MGLAVGLALVLVPGLVLVLGTLAWALGLALVVASVVLGFGFG